MPFGLKCVNAANEVQIDSTYRNFSLYQQGNATIPGTGARYVDLSFPVTTLPPIIAIRLHGTYGACVYGQTTSAARLFSQRDCSAFAVPYAIFLPGFYGTSDHYGLVVRNESNKTVFASYNKTLNIRGVYSVTIPGSASGLNTYADVTVNNATSNYFFLFPQGFFTGRFSVITPTMWEYFVAATTLRYANAATVRVATQDIYHYAYSAGGGYGYWPTSLTLIEVSV